MKENLEKKPQNIDKHNWYYEEYGGVTFVHEVVDKNGNIIQTDQFRVPWGKLLASCERKYA